MAEYIEREALIEKCKAIIQDKWNDKVAPISWSHAYADFIEDIENQPAADVAPVVNGRWIRFKEHDSCYVHMRCSECSAYWSDPSHADSFRYCPNCGAKMDGE